MISLTMLETNVFCQSVYKQKNSSGISIHVQKVILFSIQIRDKNIETKQDLMLEMFCSKVIMLLCSYF